MPSLSAADASVNVLVPVREDENPFDFGPVVVLHTHKKAAIGPNNPGHVFGPFRTVSDAITFTGEVDADDEAGHEDHCIKTIIPLNIAPDVRIITIRVAEPSQPATLPN